MHWDFVASMRSRTISSIEKNNVWTGAGFSCTQAASWAIDWTVHSRRKKLAGSWSHIVCRVRRIWQHSRESWERSKEACSRWKAFRFFTAEPERKSSKLQTTFNIKHMLKLVSKSSYTYIDKLWTNNATCVNAWKHSLICLDRVCLPHCQNIYRQGLRFGSKNTLVFVVNKYAAG